MFKAISNFMSDVKAGLNCAVYDIDYVQYASQSKKTSVDKIFDSVTTVGGVELIGGALAFACGPIGVGGWIAVKGGMAIHNVRKDKALHESWTSFDHLRVIGQAATAAIPGAGSTLFTAVNFIEAGVDMSTSNNSKAPLVKLSAADYVYPVLPADISDIRKAQWNAMIDARRAAKAAKRK